MSFVVELNTAMVQARATAEKDERNRNAPRGPAGKGRIANKICILASYCKDYLHVLRASQRFDEILQAALLQSFSFIVHLEDNNKDAEMETSRRSFLKAGALAGLVLAAGGGLYRAVHTPAPRACVLDGEARAALEAIVPALLAGALPADPAERRGALDAAVAGIHAAIASLPLAVQQEVQDLFGLLALAPARRLLTGIEGGWAGATDAEVAAFLHAWRLHRFALLRTAYGTLHDLALGAWYAQPASWHAIGYPGPMKELA